MRYLARFLCFLGFHREPEYLGQISVKSVDKSTHAIVYANRLQCPRCGKTLFLDYS